MTDNDDATNELIARILAADNEQHAYEASYDDFGDGEASDDSDFGHPRKKKARKGRASQNEPLAKREREARPPASQDELTATGRRKRKDIGARREGTAKGWTEEEERLFLEGLELFGREWHKAAAHVGSRDKKAFTSHAQKHFIKLCIADRPLPEKVIATGLGDGRGYTLSGLPLDPHSSSAKSYGFKPEHLTRLVASDGPGARGLLLPGKENFHIRASRRLAKPSSGAADTVSTMGADDSSLAAKQPVLPINKDIRSPEQSQEPTEYVKNRPRREGAGMKSSWGQTSESLELVQCKEFMGPPGSGAALAQPFEVTMHGQVNLVMDFHAHLCGCEIIGLLGGTWDPAARHMHIQEAFPCKRVAGSHSGTSVEIDPEAQVQAQEAMEQSGLISVGWYHSHPIFAPVPSQKDNENQRNWQAMHKCSVSGLEPCVGIIVGPYDQSLTSEASKLTYFIVQNRGGNLVPFNVRLKAVPSTPELPNDKLEEKLRSLIMDGAADPNRISLAQEWRPYRLLVDGQGSGIRLSHLMKLRLAISHHFKGEGSNSEHAAELLDRLFSYLKEAWGLDNAAGQESKACGGNAKEEIQAGRPVNAAENAEGQKAD